MTHTVRVDTSPIYKGEEVKALKARHSRRIEKLLTSDPETKANWKKYGISWVGVDKTRVKVTAHAPDDTARVQAGGIAEEIAVEKARRDQLGNLRKLGDRNVVQGQAMPQAGEVQGVRKAPLKELPTALPVAFNARTGTVVVEGSGVHNEGVGHYQVSSGMGGVSGARYVRTPDQGDGQGMGEVEKVYSESRNTRGKSDLHGGTQSREPRRGALELAMFEMRVQDAERKALELCGQPGGSKAHKSAKNMRRAYELEALRHKTGGVMERLHSFENGARSTRNQARNENKGTLPQARI